MTTDGFIPPHGGYQNLLSYRKAEIVYDATVYFCERFIDRRSRTHDQMVQAARSGKQNIIDGSMASGTSKATEIKLTNVARASLETRPPEVVANIIICLIHQTNFLPDRQLGQLEKAFIKEGSLRERMTHARLEERKKSRR